MAKTVDEILDKHSAWVLNTFLGDEVVHMNLEEAKADLKELLLSELPDELPVKARQTGTRSIQALGYNQCRAEVVSAINDLFKEK